MSSLREVFWCDGWITIGLNSSAVKIQNFGVQRPNATAGLWGAPWWWSCGLLLTILGSLTCTGIPTRRRFCFPPPSETESGGHCCCPLLSSPHFFVPPEGGQWEPNFVDILHHQRAAADTSVGTKSGCHSSSTFKRGCGIIPGQVRLVCSKFCTHFLNE